MSSSPTPRLLTFQELLDDLDEGGQTNVSSPPVLVAAPPTLLIECILCCTDLGEQCTCVVLTTPHTPTPIPTPVVVAPPVHHPLSNRPFMDESLRASLLRQGKVGLTRQEGRRKRNFKTAEEARQWPIPYHGQSQEDYRTEQLSFLVGVSYRLMKAHGDLPPTGTTPGREEVSSELKDKYQELVFQDALEAAGDYVVSELSHSGQWLRDFGGTAGGRTRYKTTSGEVTYDALWKLCRVAFAFAWDNWDHEYYDKLSKWGATGGGISRRGRTWTPDMLDDILHLTREQQREHLGCSKSTIKNLRREHDHYKKPDSEVAQPVEKPTEASATVGTQDLDALGRTSADCIEYRTHTRRSAMHSVRVAVPSPHRGRSRTRRATFADFAGIRCVSRRTTSSSPHARRSRGSRRSSRSRGSVAYDGRRATTGGSGRGP
jgi:hypothetical protein